MTPLSRRQLLAGLLAAAGASACGPIFEIDRRNSSEAPSGARSDSSTVSLDPTPSLDAGGVETAGPYQPIEGEAFPDAKRVAARFVERLGTYGPTDEPREIVAAAAKDAHPDFRVRPAAREARAMIVPGAKSTATVVYPQLGGLDPHSDPRRAAMMVVVRQRLERADGSSQNVTRTVDVRLEKVDGEWAVSALRSAGGDPVPRPDNLSRVATAVLDDSRISLPDSARWDIHSGAIDQRVLRTMSALSELYPYSVTVLRTGHPRSVFGASVVSNHTVGRAVDIWSIGGAPVVTQHRGITYDAGDVRRTERRRPAFRAAKELLRDDVGELGSPWNLDPSGQPSFTDPVHVDHLHVAFSAQGR